MASELKILTLPVTGMHCAACASFIERQLAKVPGVSAAAVNYGTEKLKLSFEPANAPLEDLAKRVADMGYGPVLPRPEVVGGADRAEEAGEAELRSLTAKVEFSLPLAVLVFGAMLWDLAAGPLGWPPLPIPMAMQQLLLFVVSSVAHSLGLAPGAFYDVSIVVTSFVLYGKLLEARSK